MYYKQLYKNRKTNYAFTEENIHIIDNKEKIELDELFFLILLLNDDCSPNIIQKVKFFLSILDYEEKRKLFKNILCTEQPLSFFSFLRLHILTVEDCSIFFSVASVSVQQEEMPLFDKALILSKLSKFQIIYDDLDMTNLLSTLMKDALAHVNKNKKDFNYLISFEISSKITQCSTQVLEAYEVLKNKNLNFYSKGKITTENFTNLLKLLDFNSNYQILELLKTSYTKYSLEEKKEIKQFINENITLIDIDFVVTCINILEESNQEFFRNILRNEGIARIERLSFFSERILRNEKLKILREDPTTLALDIIEKQLSNPKSKLDLVIYCSNKLNEITELFPENDKAINLYKELYENSPYWSELYRQRTKRQKERKIKISKQVHSSLARKVEAPFKNKDYQKVIDILKDFDNLPKSLQLKYSYSLRKLNN